MEQMKKYIRLKDIINMNKKDLLLIIIVLFICIVMFLLFSNKSGSYAYVYYENKVIKKINMNINGLYTVQGYNGDVVIEVLNNKIRVKEETSNKNICSNMGFVSSPLEPIICLPNKIVVKIIEDSEIDTIIR